MEGDVTRTCCRKQQKQTFKKYHNKLKKICFDSVIVFGNNSKRREDARFSRRNWTRGSFASHPNGIITSELKMPFG